MRVTKFSGCFCLILSIGFFAAGSFPCLAESRAGIQVPGSATYPNGLMAEVGSVYLPNESDLTCAIMDKNIGFAWFGTRTTPGQIVKISLGAGDAPDERLGSIFLNDDEGPLVAAAYDPVTRYAWFATSSLPSKLIKFHMGHSAADLPRRVGALTLPTSDRKIGAMVINAQTGYGWLGTVGRVVKVKLGAGDSGPIRLNSVSFAAPESGQVMSGVISTSSGMALFGTAGVYPGSREPRMEKGFAVKVLLGANDSPPERIGGVQFPEGIFPDCAVIEKTEKYAIFACQGAHVIPERFGFQIVISLNMPVKIKIGDGTSPPTVVGYEWFPVTSRFSGNKAAFTAIYDKKSGQAIFGLGDRIAKYTFRADDNEVEFVSESMEKVYNGHCAVIDSEKGYAWFAGIYQSTIKKVALGTGTTPPQQKSAVKLISNEIEFWFAEWDNISKFAYFCSNLKVVKVSMGLPATSPVRIGSAELDRGDDGGNGIHGTAIDLVHRHLYVNYSDAIQFKLSLGAGFVAPQRVSQTQFSNQYTALNGGGIDAGAGYGYFSFLTDNILKITLGNGDTPTTIASMLSLPLGSYPRAAVLNPNVRRAWFGGGNTPAKIFTIDIQEGNSSPTLVNSVNLSNDEDHIVAAVLDRNTGYGYFRGIDIRFDQNARAFLAKYALGNGTGAPRRVGTLWLDGEDSGSDRPALDSASGVGWMWQRSSYNSKSSWLHRFKLGDVTSTPTLVGTYPLTEPCTGSASIIDPDTGYAMAIRNGEVTKIVKLRLSAKGAMHATAIPMPESGALKEIRFYSHANKGKLRLALYRHGVSTRDRLWQSPLISPAATPHWNSIQIASGTPNTLLLIKGDYWLAWQTDSNADVMSYVPSTQGQGFTVPWSFGAFPNLLSESDATTSWTTTAARWSAYLAYEPKAAVDQQLWQNLN